VSCILLIGAVLWVHPAEVWRQLMHIGLPGLAGATALLLLSLLFNAIRFRRLLSMNGFCLGWIPCLQTFMAGNLGSLFFLPLLGQAGARQAMLEKNEVPAEVNAALIIIERGATALISASFALLAFINLTGLADVENWLASIRIVPMALAFALTLVFLAFIYPAPAKMAAKEWASPLMLARTTEVLFWTLLQLVAMVGCFAFLAHQLAPNLQKMDLWAAAFIVSFCGSLPISVGGWGIREVSAMWIFGKLGMPTGQALAVTVATGLLWLVLVLICSGAVLGMRRSVAQHSEKQSNPPSRTGVTGFTMLAVPMLGAAVILYQFHVVMASGSINVNLADPFAMLALAVVAAECIKNKRWPEWSMKHFNYVFLLFGALMVYGFVVYCFRFGSFGSASSSRVFGWAVLVGYCAMGSLFIRSLGCTPGRDRAAIIVACAAAAIVGVDLGYRLLFVAGVLSTPPTQNFEGFSANRNAFVFALNLVICLLLARWDGLVNLGSMKSRAQTLGLALLISAVLLSASRTGIATVIILLCMAMLFGMQKPRDVFGLLLISVCLWGLLLAFSLALTTFRALAWGGHLWSADFAQLALNSLRSVQTAVSAPESDFSRSQINAVALDLFKQSPWFGQGLGGFLERSPQTLGQSIGIHNTWLWMLVDFGLLGFSLALLIVSLICAHVIRARLWCSPDPYQRAFLLVLVCFAFFSQLHEMSFQRIMWFCLGLLLAAPRKSAAAVQVCEVTQDATSTELRMPSRA
jgi:O-antigen ligase/uncharacterized membrane protein YbhN (UPF0104 family)